MAATKPRKRTRSRKRATSSRRSARPAQLEYFRAFCRKLRLENGQPLELYPEQLDMLAGYFNGVRESLVLLPKKNGKTTLLAALGLYHLATTPDAACYIGAASRDQASILFEQAAGLVRRSEYAQQFFDTKAGYREIRSKTDAGRLRVLAADANTADGVIPTLALVDELHRHRNGDLYGVFRDGLGPRQGQIITISTAGDSEDSALGQLRAAAYALPGIKRRGAYRCVRTEGFAMHEWALEDTDDREDMKVVKRANPAPWQTVEALRERFASPSMTQWQWARFACGVWIVGEDTVIAEREWSACANPDVELEPTESVIVAVDLGWKWDTTAIITGSADGSRIGRAQIIVPPRDGTAIAVEVIQEALAEEWDNYAEVRFVLDPEAGGEPLGQWLEAEFGAEVIAHSQKASAMALASQGFSEAVSAGRIEHPDDPRLNAHVLAAGAKAVGEGWRFVKSKRTRKPIDGVIAAAMWHRVATMDVEAPAPMVYVLG